MLAPNTLFHSLVERLSYFGVLHSRFKKWLPSEKPEQKEISNPRFFIMSEIITISFHSPFSETQRSKEFEVVWEILFAKWSTSVPHSNSVLQSKFCIQYFISPKHRLENGRIARKMNEFLCLRTNVNGILCVATLLVVCHLILYRSFNFLVSIHNKVYS